MEMATGNYVINHMNFENKNVELYMSLFRGRQDIYAKYWEKNDP
jgi:hypothetical protein